MLFIFILLAQNYYLFKYFYLLQIRSQNNNHQTTTNTNNCICCFYVSAVGYGEVQSTSYNNKINHFNYNFSDENKISYYGEDMIMY